MIKFLSAPEISDRSTYPNQHLLRFIKHGFKDDNVFARIDIISINSADYISALTLREEILRRPLGLKLSLEDIAHDEDEYHLGAFVEAQLIGNVSLKPISLEVVQLRQMAIAPNYQSQGMGGKLLKYAEQYSIARNFREIKLHARCHVQGFYTKFGYIPQGEPFIEVTIPHILMRKQLV
ncbi:GNAT family N-acetyltransferase [Gloeocapsa sp. PCC 73106]|uniref:GNAT family N-acetyltransferase n=1 Tax=Gloeocapsa sp. PCC 73106 TaxID=102232 RepID=UPI0002AC3D8C|nr:GNAT family N-acetyltransferase [Gloeocapsa sp. PCC 73106]ELR98147.1 putative acyltransferase [Gloeocapsa sp. PCC 73106]